VYLKLAELQRSFEWLWRGRDVLQAALEVLSPDSYLQDRAMIENNLGEAYLLAVELEAGDPEENLTLAEALFESALSVYTEALFPDYHGVVRANLSKVSTLRGTSAGAPGSSVPPEL
jgi:hypothetical protein